jgi:hypothetical protein
VPSKKRAYIHVATSSICFVVETGITDDSTTDVDVSFQTRSLFLLLNILEVRGNWEIGMTSRTSEI